MFWLIAVLGEVMLRVGLYPTGSFYWQSINYFTANVLLQDTEEPGPSV